MVLFMLAVSILTWCDVVVFSSELEVPAQCSEHTQQPIEYFCETDSMLICGRCAITGSHKGHDIKTLDEKVF